VLLEDESEADPVGEEVKSLIDGHLYLSGKLAGRGHYPALDVLRSGSRLFGQLASPTHQAAASRLRSVMGTLDDLQLMRELGEYKPGISAQYDAAIALEPRLNAFLQQPPQQADALLETLEALHALAQ
jgi:type III secretion protein N (ATPase)